MCTNDARLHLGSVYVGGSSEFELLAAVHWAWDSSISQVTEIRLCIFVSCIDIKKARSCEAWDKVKVEYVCTYQVTCGGLDCTLNKCYFHVGKQVQWIHLPKNT